MREVAHVCMGERSREVRHPLLPMHLSTNTQIKCPRGIPNLNSFLSNDRETLDLAEVSAVPLDGVPQRTCIPTMENVHDHQESDLAVFRHQLLGFRNELFVIRTVQCSVKADLKQVFVNLFVNVCGAIHFVVLF